MRTIPELEEGTHRAKATGILPNGKPVVVNADGTVSVVTTTPANFGSPSIFESAVTPFPSATFDNNSNKVVVAYRDDGNSGFGTAVVGTVSGTSISFGTPVVFESASSDYTSATFDSNSNKVVVAYRDIGNSNSGTAVVGTVSGTSISFGSAVVFEASNNILISTAFDSNSNKVVIAYRNFTNSNFGTAIVGTVSGISISFGSPVVFRSATIISASATFDSNSNKVVISYGDGGNSFFGTTIIGTVSGTAISFGSPVVFQSSFSVYHSATFDSNSNKVVVAYRDDGNSSYGTAVVGTVSGTSISFGSAVVFEAASSSYISAAFDSNSNKILVTYSDEGNSSYVTAVVGTVSGASISFGAPVVFENRAITKSAIFDSHSNKVVVAYRDGSSSFGTASVFSSFSTNLTSENYIGISTGGTYADGSSATVDIIGTVNGQQSGLTAGQSYYVQTDGTIATTPATPEVFAGTAISTTSLIVKT